jgi:hypothetical protein
MEKQNYLYGYPELSEIGKENTKRILEKFKSDLSVLFNETLFSFTSNLANEIVDDDSWVDIREKTRDALCGYPSQGQYSSVNWEKIRKKIFEENREDIVNDIILDKEKEIERLKSSIDYYFNDRQPF